MGHGYGTLWHYYPDLETSKQFVSGDPHSGFLAIMTNQGFIGLAVFLWLMITAIKTGWGLYRGLEDGFLKQLALLLTLGLNTWLVMFFVSAQIERSIYTYLAMGLITSIYSVSSGKDNLPVDAIR